MSDSEKFKEELPSKDEFYSSLTDKKSDKEYDYHDLYLKCNI